MNSKKIIFEYPVAWVCGKDQQNIDFVNNIIVLLNKMNVITTLIPVEFPCYGVPRISKDITLSFHSYKNDTNLVWSYKEAPIKGYYSIDPMGYGGWSDIHQNIDKYLPEIENVKNYDKTIESIRYYIESGVTKHKQSKQVVRIDFEYLLVALQMRTDSVADHAYLDVVDVLDYINQISIKYQKNIIIKPHPKCDSEALQAYIFQLSLDNPLITVNKGNIIDLIKNSKAVLNCNSGVGLEALFLGKKVYSFGASEWSYITNNIKSIGELDKLFAELDEEYCLSDFQRKYLAYLVEKYWVRGSDLNAIKNKIQVLLLQSNGVGGYESTIQGLLNFQKKYSLKLNKTKLIEKDFELQNKVLKRFKKNPIFVVYYFFVFLFNRIRAKIKM